MSVRIQVLFYSMYGHIYRMSEAVVEGAREVEGAEVSLYQVAELVPEEALEKIGVKAAGSVATLKEQAQEGLGTALHHLAIWYSPAMKSRRRPT